VPSRLAICVGPYHGPVDVVVTEAARAYMRDHGGAVYVDSHSHRCCTGTLTLLDTTTKRPLDSFEFGLVDAGDGVEVHFRDGPEGRPAQLGIELRGRFWPRLVASWDGCAYKM
jgi:hypothetical protein